MYPLRESGPYYAIMLGAGALDTNGGPAIDARARVLDTYGQPIPGLYGVGNCIASPSREAYWGAGCPLALSLTYGYIAANDAHGDARKEA
jgi:predicted oxidoreductase